MDNKPFFIVFLAACVVLLVIASSQTIQKYFPFLDTNSYKEIDTYWYKDLKKELQEQPLIKKDLQEAYLDEIISVREWIDIKEKIKIIEKPKTDSELLEQKKSLIEKVYH
jgi:hypothetical protein